MSYPPLPEPLPPTKPHSPSPTRRFLTHHLPLILTICTVFLITLTAVLLLPITGLDLSLSILGQGKCPCLRPQPLSRLHSKQYTLSSFRENPLNDTFTPPSPSPPSSSDASSGESDGDAHYHDHAWEAKVIPPTTGGGLFAAFADDVTEALVDRVDPKRTHSGTLQRSYGIAMFHQLHCLGALRGRLFAERGGGHDDHGNKRGHTDGDEGLSEEEADHLHHCFDYILQSILCAASDTIEMPKHIVEDGTPMWHIDGIGDVHRCRDPKVLWKMSERSLRVPVDMRTWKGEEGVGAREFFGLE